jgi:hypothetical protein
MYAVPAREDVLLAAIRIAIGVPSISKWQTITYLENGLM